MAHVLDFNTRKKEYLTVKLNDEKKTVLMIGTPTKAVLEEFKALEVNSSDDTTIDDLFNVCAKVMSFNKGGIKITAEYLEGFFDIDDITAFFNGYAEFIKSVTEAKN